MNRTLVTAFAADANGPETGSLIGISVELGGMSVKTRLPTHGAPPLSLGVAVTVRSPAIARISNAVVDQQVVSASPQLVTMPNVAIHRTKASHARGYRGRPAAMQIILPCAST